MIVSIRSTPEGFNLGLRSPSIAAVPENASVCACFPRRSYTVVITFFNRDILNFNFIFIFLEKNWEVWFNFV